MRAITLGEFARTVGGQCTGPTDAPISGFATDSRDVQPGSLFLAIRGENVDGHNYVPQALLRGAVASLVERPVDGPHILVPNLVEALAFFGRSIRDGFDGPVVGVTGSAGKTTSKEFLAAALSARGKVLKTHGNRNTEYTSPLLWAELEPDTRSVVVEMAMRGFGQIAHLAAISRPTVAVITNVGWAHMLQVGSREGIARAKGELIEALPPDGAVVAWAEDDFVGKLREIAGPRRFRTFGFGERADCRILSTRALDWRSSAVTGELDGARWEAVIPAVGRHLALSAAAAVLGAAECGVNAQAGASKLAAATLPPMRMEVRELNGATILLDTYNASPPSMIGAIEALADLTPAGHRKAVIGEMKELGEHTEDAHRSIGAALAQHAIDEVLFVGAPMELARAEALAAGRSASAYRMANGIDDVRAFLAGASSGDAVLIKGSRALELEKALEGLGERC